MFSILYFGSYKYQQYFRVRIVGSNNYYICNSLHIRIICQDLKFAAIMSDVSNIKKVVFSYNKMAALKVEVRLGVWHSDSACQTDKRWQIPSLSLQRPNQTRRQGATGVLIHC